MSSGPFQNTGCSSSEGLCKLIRLLIAGDTCPVGRNQDLFEAGDAHALLNDLRPMWEQADLRIANLECPLIERESPTEKVGPNLGLRAAAPTA